MLYALANPLSLGVLLVSFVVGLTLRGWVQALLADRMGDRRPRQEGRLKTDPRVQIDPFGVVGALISGLGWTRPVELHHPRRTPLAWVVLLGGPLVNVGLGLGLLLAWRLAYGPGSAFDGGAAYLLQHGADLDGLAQVLLLAGASQLYLGALALVPLPPLDGGRLMLALAPRTQGWLKAEHHLVERNIGIAVLLALLIIPLGGPVPLLPHLLDVLLQPVVDLVCGA